MAVIDWIQFNENFQYYDSEIIIEVINLFIDEHQERITELEKNIKEQDYSTLAFNAHSLKSVISNYMAPRALELTCKLEELGKKKSDEGINDLFADLKITVNEMLLELKDYLEKKG